MRIGLFLAGAHDDATIAALPSAAGAYARHIGAELRHRGHEIVFARCLASLKYVDEATHADRLAHFRALDLPELDHAICLEQNGFEAREPAFFEAVRARTRGHVCTMEDAGAGRGPEDLNFCARRPPPTNPKAHYVGWAADPAIFHPEQSTDVLRVFVDHKYFPGPDSERDWTERVLEDAIRFARAYNAGKLPPVGEKSRAEVLFFGPRGIRPARLRPNEPRTFGPNRRDFYRRVAPETLAAAYRGSDIFMVTHIESMGLPLLESAMSGAFLLSPRRFARPELIMPLLHREYDERVNWEKVIAALQPAESARRARPFTWQRTVDRILEGLSREAQTEQAPLRAVTPAAERTVTTSTRCRWTAPPDQWDRARVTVEPGGPDLLAGVPSYQVRSTAEGGDHHLHRRFEKSPWPLPCTCSVIVRPGTARRIRLRLFGADQSERAEVLIDFDRAVALPSPDTPGWTCFDAGVQRVHDDAWLCWLVARSNHFPQVGAALALERGGRLDFAGMPDVAVEIGAIDVRLGLPLAFELPPATEHRAARQGSPPDL